MEITIDTNGFNSSDIEVIELKKYLESKKWSFEIEEELEIKYLLKENSIHIVGSHNVPFNDKIKGDELHEYSIINRKDYIDELIGWIGEANSSNKAMMKNDLEMLMDISDDYILSSNSTNSFLFNDCVDFDSTCEELIKLNNELNEK